MVIQGAGSKRLAVMLLAGMLTGCFEQSPASGSPDAPSSVDLPPGIDTPAPEDGNRPPVIEVTPPTSVVAGTSYLFQPVASDADGDVLRFEASGLPAWAQLDPARGEISGTPSDTDEGISADILLSVSDSRSTVSLPAFHIVVEPRPLAPAPPPPANRAPTITGTPPGSVQATQPYRFTPQASDPDGGALRFSIRNKPSWASFSTVEGTLAGTPGALQVARYRNIVISVSDGQLQAELAPFSIEVTPAPNRAPVISGTPGSSAQVGTAWRFAPEAHDEDGDPLQFSATGVPNWLRLDPDSGVLEGTPAAGDVRRFSGIRVTVTDGMLSATLGPFSITVAATPNTPPTLAGVPSTTATVNRPYEFRPSGHDTDGDALQYSITNRPGWASFDTTSGVLSGTPGFDQVGTHNGIVVSVSDGKSSVSLPAFSITVTAALNAPPTITGTPGTQATAGTTYSFTPQASDPEGRPLVFSIQNRPGWASFSATSGVLSGTPGSSDVRAYPNILISVSDGASSVALPAFTLTVLAPPNRPPAIGGTPGTQVVAGNPYRFTPTASDPDGDPLTFSIRRRPAWATFNTATGMLSGTPSREQAARYTSIVISVSDGEASRSLPAFDIEVEAPANHPPTLSGTPPASVDSGSTWSFTPTAHDADQDALVFSVQNLPAWASFDASSGRLYGQPGNADEGSYDGIVISVSDGEASASLPAFSIRVQVPASGSASLSWTAPTQNEDGSVLTDLAGFYVYAGNSPSTLARSTTIASPAAAGTTVGGLPSGTHCFAVSAYTTSGVESGRTAAACKSVP